MISAESTLSLPTVPVEWMIWRCRLLASTVSKSTRPKRADACGGKIERKRRAEAAGADAEDFGGLQFLLALHAYFGQDQVARVARDLVVGELGEFNSRKS